MKTIEALELEFDEFFKGMTFERVSLFAGHSPNFKNADYIQTTNKLIFELKILDKNFFEGGGIIDRFHSLVPSPVNVDDKGLGLYEIKWPELNREKRFDTFEEPLRRILKKANRQLKETNEHYFKNSGTGFLCLAMHGFDSLHPATVNNLVQELLLQDFNAITGFILCMPTWGYYDSNGNLGHPVIYGSCAPGTSPIVISQLQVIADNWVAFLENGRHKSEE